MLGAPNETRYDLRFHLLGIPVRVHPLFWLLALLVSGQWNARGGEDLLPLAVWVPCVFVSIVVHELGHGLSSRVLGYEPEGIVLYSMGGYCLVPLDQQRPWQRIVVLLFGPGAGFLLLALVLGIAGVFWRVNPVDVLALFVGPGNVGEALDRLPTAMTVRLAFLYLVEINLLWGLLNLLPIWPLDGGRVTEVVLGRINRFAATRWTHVVGLLTGGVLALLWFAWGDTFMAIWFGLFGALNFRMLQTHYDAHKTGRGEWWN
jgi:stage IV sporulation protein FB